jgi:hypothetical protein
MKPSDLETVSKEELIKIILMQAEQLAQPTCLRDLFCPAWEDI